PPPAPGPPRRSRRLGTRAFRGRRFLADRPGPQDGDEPPAPRLALGGRPDFYELRLSMPNDVGADGPGAEADAGLGEARLIHRGPRARHAGGAQALRGAVPG